MNNVCKLFGLLIFAMMLCVHSFSAKADEQTANVSESWAQLSADHPILYKGSTEHRFAGAPSADTTPVYIRYDKNLYLKLPRNNLIELEILHYGHSDPEVHFNAGLLYPSFAGATVETLGQFDFRGWQKSPNMILLEGPYTYLAHANKDIFAVENVADKEKAEYGLMKVKHHPSGQSSDSFFYISDHWDPVIIECDKIFGNPVPLCKVRVNITDEYQITYTYPRMLLSEWKTIHEHVLNLINASLRKG